MEIKAKFKGRDGSVGYRNGETYKLEFKTVDDDNRQGCDHLILISRINEVNRAIGTNLVVYDTMRGFLNNWQILR